MGLDQHLSTMLHAPRNEIIAEFFVNPGHLLNGPFFKRADGVAANTEIPMQRPSLFIPDQVLNLDGLRNAPQRLQYDARSVRYDSDDDSSSSESEI